MERFNDFRQKLIELIGKRVRLSFYLIDIQRHWSLIGRIIDIDEKRKCLEFEIDQEKYEKGDLPITKTWLNLSDGGAIIYAVDEIPEDADLTKLEEKK